MPRLKTDDATIKRGLKFSKLIKEARESNGLSQVELAAKAGISIDTVRSIETNKIVAPSVFVAIDLVNALEGAWGAWIKKLDGKES